MQAAGPGDERLAALQRVEQLQVEREYEARRLVVLKAREQANRDVANELRFGSAGDRLRKQPQVFAAVSADLMLDFPAHQAEGIVLREQTDLRAKIADATARVEAIDAALPAANAAFRSYDPRNQIN
ncbi:Hypothetical Protein FCC1311_107672 [Hondaea fermentalgiana]|uniref:Uncharacterized protein n=1 Tax=Hondaea fermentalgiana TaxID=2315210 RepID=A0A2R5H0F9_9STRA|nr:Hypothetical Protein FCC1311_107672 [Hondaea fermentalgiana]|eukprot:GBG34543.1 Hypothetical Protein FCC1311_107672 [Hondaea fermentalgiana]